MSKSTLTSPSGTTIEFDAIRDKSTTIDADAQEYPVEGGFNVADHVVKHLEKIDLTAHFEATGTYNSFTKVSNINSKKLQIASTITALKKMLMSGEILTLTTYVLGVPKRFNVVLTSVSVPYQYSLSVDVGLKFVVPRTAESTIVSSVGTVQSTEGTEIELTEIDTDEPQSGATGEDAGTVPTNDVNGGYLMKVDTSTGIGKLIEFVLYPLTWKWIDYSSK